MSRPQLFPYRRTQRGGNWPVVRARLPQGTRYRAITHGTDTLRHSLAVAYRHGYVQGRAQLSTSMRKRRQLGLPLVAVRVKGAR